MQRIVINGEPGEQVPATDRALHYGDGLFETIACVNHSLQFWDQHMRRMREGAERLGIDFPAEALFLQDIKRLCSENEAGNYVVKLLLSRGSGERGYRVSDHRSPLRIVMLSDRPAYADELCTTGVDLCRCRHVASVNPDLAGIKHLNRLDNVLARNEWTDQYHEGLMSSADGNIIEGTMTNLFGVKGNVLITPALERCGIDGIIRQQVLAMAQLMNIDTDVRDIMHDDVIDFDELFVTNSIIGIWPVRRYLDTHYQPGQITRKLADELQRRMLNHAKVLA